MYKKIVTSCLFIFMLLFSLSVAHANVNWFTIGNYGASTIGMSGNDYVLWGSNYPYGDYDNFNYIINITGTYGDFPLFVTDLDQDGNNELYLIDGNTIYIYDAFGTFLNSKTVNGNILNNPVQVTYRNDNIVTIAILTDQSLQTFYMYNNNLILDKEIILDDIGYGDYQYGFMGYFTSSRIIAFADGHRYTVYDLATDDQGYFSLPSNRLTPRYNNRQSMSIMIDFNNDGNNEVFVVNRDSVSGGYYNVDRIYIDTAKLTGFTTITDELFYTTSKITSYSTPLNIEVANIGDPKSQNELIISYREDYFGYNKLEVVDNNGNNKLTRTQSGSAPYYSAVADINKNGNNELCFIEVGLTYDTHNLKCYDSSYNVIINAQISPNYLSSNNYDRFSIGVYEDNQSYQNVISRNGIYRLINSTHTQKVYNLTVSGNIFMSYPVSVTRKNEYIKDLVVQHATGVTLYLDYDFSAVCGNGICETGETVLNCPEDCLKVDTSAYMPVVTKIKYNPSPRETWKRGTRVAVEVCAYSPDNVGLQARLTLYQGTEFEQQSDWIAFSSKTCRTLNTYMNNETINNFIANESVANGVMVVDVSRYNNEDYIVSYTEYFTVAQEGISFGEQILSFIPDESTPSQPPDKDPETNAILRGINEFSGLFGLSSALVYWFIIFLVIFGIVSHDVRAGRFSTQTFGVVALVFIIMLYLGVRFGLISWTLIMIMGILSAFPIYLILRKFLPQ